MNNRNSDVGDDGNKVSYVGSFNEAKLADRSTNLSISQNRKKYGQINL